MPKEFYSFETNKPFSHCIECHKYLLQDDCEYFIEKAIRNYIGFTSTDTIFDFAICLSCTKKLSREISEESQRKMLNYFAEHTPTRAEYSTKKCLIKRKHVDQCEEYQLFALCVGREISPKQKPYMISSEVIGDIFLILSKPTIDFLNGFREKHSTPNPSLLQPRPPLILV